MIHDHRNGGQSERSARRRVALRVHPEQAAHALPVASGGGPGRDRRRARGADAGQAPAHGSAEDLQRPARLGNGAQARRQRARDRGPHDRGPGDDAPGQAAADRASSRRRGHLLDPRAAVAARQRPARAGGHGIDEGHRGAAQVGESRRAAAERRPAAADAGRVGGRAERAALRRAGSRTSRSWNAHGTGAHGQAARSSTSRWRA